MTDTKRGRGRPKVAPTPGERVPLGLRVTADIKEGLDAAAERAGRSQSQEAEFRLERSFELDRQFGGPEMVAIVNLMAGAFLRGGQLGAAAAEPPITGGPAAWMLDPFCYDAAVAAVVDALRAAQPVQRKWKEGVTPAQQQMQENLIRHFATLTTPRTAALRGTTPRSATPS